MIGPCLILGSATAQVAPEPVVRTLTDQVTVDWSTLEIEVHATATAQTVGSLRAVEELARLNVTKALERALPEVALTSTTRLGEILDDAVLGPPITSRQARWQVTEARYGTSGTVTLTASLSLSSVVKPWVLANAVTDAPEPSGAPPFTGVLVDARAVAPRMAVAPRILTESGAIVFDGGLDEFSAVTRSPVRYVTAPEAAHRLGDRPWRLLATGVSGGVDLVVADVDPQTIGRAASLVRTGEIVVAVRSRNERSE
ncbi:MAG: hypothetical protein AAF602_33250 [Myxococcota bacterium]